MKRRSNYSPSSSPSPPRLVAPPPPQIPRIRPDSPDRNLGWAGLTDSLPGFGNTGTRIGQDYESRVSRRSNPSPGPSSSSIQYRSDRYSQPGEGGSHTHTPPPTVAVPAQPAPLGDAVRYPSKLYECDATVQHLQDGLGCGVLVLHGADNRKAYCLFFGKDLLLSQMPAIGGNKLSDYLKEGMKLHVNARLMDGRSPIPYLASTVWEVGLEISSDNMAKMFALPDTHDSNAYKSLSMDLSWQLPSLQLTTPPAALARRPSPPEVIQLDDDDEDIQPLNISASHHSTENLLSLNTQRDPHYRSTSTPRARTQDESYSGSSSRGSRSRSRHGSRQRSPSRESDMFGKSCRIFDKHFEERYLKLRDARVHSYLNPEYGILRTCDSESLVYFNSAHAWIDDGSSELKPFKEIYPNRKLRHIFSLNDQVRCKVIPIRDKEAKYMALGVWKPTERRPPSIKISNEFKHNVKYHLSILEYFKTNSFTSLDVNPFSKYDIYDCTVQEYISYEVGLLKLGANGVALFNMGEVWIKTDDGLDWKRFRKENDILENRFPIGSQFHAIVREIPHSSFSELRFQALAVYEGPRNGKENSEIYIPFVEKYMRNESKIGLLTKLEKQYDAFKNFCRLDLAVEDKAFKLVPLVINVLPSDWRAVIRKEVTKDIGLIMIYSRFGSNTSLDKSVKIQHLYVLFHIEDVYETNYAKKDKLLKTNKSIGSLLNVKVDLNARSICPKLGPSGIFTFQEKLNKKSKDSQAPVLQAIHVLILDDFNNFSSLSKPTCLRSRPGNFDFLRSSAFYMNGLLLPKLNEKLFEYSFVSNIDHIQPEESSLNADSVICEMNQLDSWNSPRLIFGSLNVDAMKNVQAETLKKTHVNVVSCRVIFLNRNGLSCTSGVIEFVVPNTKIKSYALFNKSNYISIKGAPVSTMRLVDILPVNSRDCFCARVQLWDATSEIPYLVVNIWNDTEREKVHKSFPPGEILSKEYVESMSAEVRKILSKFSEIEIIEVDQSSEVELIPEQIDCSRSNDNTGNVSNTEDVSVKRKTDDESKVKSSKRTRPEKELMDSTKRNKPANDSSNDNLVVKNSVDSCIKDSVDSCSKDTISEDHRKDRICHRISVRSDLSEPDLADPSSGASARIQTSTVSEVIPNSHTGKDVSVDDLRNVLNAIKKIKKSPAVLEPKIPPTQCDKDLSQVKGALEQRGDAKKSSEVCNDTKLQDVAGKQTSAFPVYSPSKMKLGFQSAAGIYSSDVSDIDESVCLKKDGMVVEYLGNCVGVVEALISSHYAIVKVTHQDKSVRILCATDDIVKPSGHNTCTLAQVKAAMFVTGKTSCSDVLTVGKMVKLNAVLLGVSERNLAAIGYFSTCVIFGDNLSSRSVPLVPISSSLEITSSWKSCFKNILSILNENLELDTNRKETDKFRHLLTKYPPFKISYSKMSLIQLRPKDSSTDLELGVNHVAETLSEPTTSKPVEGTGKKSDKDNKSVEGKISDQDTELKEKASPLGSFNLSAVKKEKSAGDLKQLKDVKHEIPSDLIKEETCSTKQSNIKMQSERSDSSSIARDRANKILEGREREKETDGGGSRNAEENPQADFPCSPVAAVHDSQPPLVASPPSFIVNTTGIIVDTVCDLAVVRFEIEHMNLVALVVRDYLVESKSDRNSKSNCNTFRVGYPITFHAVRMEDCLLGRLDCYLATQAYTQGSQDVKERFMQGVKRSDWHEGWKKRENVKESLRKVETILKENINKLDTLSTYINCECCLVYKKSVVLKTTEESVNGHKLVIAQLESGASRYYGVYFCPLSVGFHEGDEILVNALFITPQSSINYLITDAWSLNDNEVTPTTYGYVSQEKFDFFHEQQYQSEELLYLTVLLNDKAQVETRFSALLGKLSFKEFKNMIVAFLKSIDTTIEIDSFSGKKTIKAPFSIEKMSQEAQLVLNPAQILELLIFLSDKCQQNQTSHCVQFLRPAEVKKIREGGFQRLINAVPDLRTERIAYAIPEDLIVQATELAWQGLVSPPTEGLPDTWTAKDDSWLLAGALEHGLFDPGMGRDWDLWQNLVEDTDFPFKSCVFSGDVLNQGVVNRLGYLKNIIMFRGRFLAEDYIDTNLGDSCEGEEETVGSKLAAIKTEPGEKEELPTASFQIKREPGLDCPGQQASSCDIVVKQEKNEEPRATERPGSMVEIKQENIDIVDELSVSVKMEKEDWDGV